MKTFRFPYRKTAVNALSELRHRRPEYWEKLGERMALNLFRYTAETVPAYRRFLKKHGVNPRNVRSINDVTALPCTDKRSYIRQFRFPDLFPKGGFQRITTISATSGSSGKATYFPRGEAQDAQYEYIAELFLRNQFGAHEKQTLGIIGFGLGIWIGGIFTYKAFNRIAARGYPLTLAPVGSSIEVYLTTLRDVGHFFDQVLLMGYPPFVKDVIDAGDRMGIRWSKYRLKILTAAEGFSESFREYLVKRAHLSRPFSDIVNIYGTVELGTMAHETSLANLIRHLASRKPDIAKTLFGHAGRLPTLAQYHPYLVYFQQEGEEVVATGYGSAIPLIRYRFPDRGGVISFSQMVDRLRQCGVDIFHEARRSRIAGEILKLPFVHIFEREENSVVVRGVNIYAEHIREALLRRPRFRKLLTGRFTMMKREDRLLNEYFALYVELREETAVKKTLRREIEEEVARTMRMWSSEYNDQYRVAPTRMHPRVSLHPYGHPRYFPRTGKQRWALREP